MAEHDLVVRGGTVIDGTGAPRRTADVAVSDGVVVEVGAVDGTGRREIDADGALVAPGFVDVHTHYDGQATWEATMQPSSWHGVTTVVFGNCGVGFAPVHDTDHERLVQLMEGVEDIPGTALHEGLAWNWNSLPEYLDALDGAKDMDIAAQVPHAALRLHVMGERGAKGEDATPSDIAEMGRLAAEGVTAGFLGFTTSRTQNHKTSLGEPTPTLTAAREELVGIAEAIGTTGTGVLQLVSDFTDIDGEFAIVRAMTESSGRPISFTLVESPRGYEYHRAILNHIETARADGLTVTGQTAVRPIGVLLGFECTLNPFLANPVYREVAGLPTAERTAALHDPGIPRAAARGGRREGHAGCRRPPDREVRHHVRPRRVAELRAEPGEFDGGHRCSGRASAGRGGARCASRERRHGDVVGAVLELRPGQPRRHARTALASVHRPGALRRWRPCRHHL